MKVAFCPGFLYTESKIYKKAAEYVWRCSFMKKRFQAIMGAAILLAGLTGCQEELTAEKPIIYLYPEREQTVTVALRCDGELLCTYPEYQDGWTVTARPDGTLVNAEDGEKYSYLFWEGELDTEYDMSKGFVVAGEDTAAFLREKLSQMGLTPREYNEFIVYWLPRMQDNPYNLITFQEEAYTQHAELDVTPKPDSVLRVFMAYQGLEKPISVEEPEITAFERTGFTVVEWGGTEVV